MSVFISVFLILISTSYPGFVWANCEAGGYGIHTTATYKKTDHSEVYLLYTARYKDKNKQVTADINSIDPVDPLLVFKGSMHSVQGGGLECRDRVKLDIHPKYYTDPEYEDVNPDIRPIKPFGWDLSSCDRKTQENSGYIKVDFTHKKLKFLDRLPVEKVKTVPDIDLTQEVRKVLRQSKEKFSVQSYTWEKPVEEDLKKPFDLRLEITKVGEGFYSIVSFLPIKRSKNEWAKIFGPKRELDGIDKAEWTYEFPFLFIYTKKTGLVKIGDGSECAYEMEYSEDSPARTFAYGAINGYGEETFKVTSAFSDEKSIILEINSRFAYRIDESGKLEVINYGQGC